MSGPKAAKRGRGRVGTGGARSIADLEVALGSKPGETAAPILQPPPIFPPLNRKPLPMSDSDYYKELLAKKQSLRNSMVESFAYIRAPSVKRDIARYSDKYRICNNHGSHRALLQNIPNWFNRLPTELHLKKTSRAGKKKSKKTEKAINLDVLDSKEKEELAGGVTSDEEEEGKEDEEEYDDEDEEGEGDYQLTYFDPGDNFEGDEDDNLGDY